MTRQHPSTARGFSLIEMLVVILIIAALISIVLVVGRSVLMSSRISVTKVELHNLQAAISVLEHKTGQTPTDMNSFLIEYQRLYAYQDSSGIWREHPNSITNLPSNLLTMGAIPMPGGTSLTGATAVNDGFGNPIQFQLTSPLSPDHEACFVSAGPDGNFSAPDMIYSYNP